jgi:Rieske Fe-S protein
MAAEGAESIDRRSFLATLFMGAGLVLSFGTAALYGLRYLFGRQSRPPTVNILVGSVSDISPGSSRTLTDLVGRKFLLVNSSGNIQAFDTTCTHLGCQVFWRAKQKRFHCPCHDGYFDEGGRPVAGPPPTPLRRLPVEIRGNSIFVEMTEA